MKSFRPIYKATALLYILFNLGACDDADDIKSGETGSMVIEFDNRFDGEDLALNTEYFNSSGETFTLTRLNYYISNIILTTADGDDYVVPQDESYFLVREEDAGSQEITIDHVPAADYNKVTFTIGVDSLRNTMDVTARTGVLDLAYSEVMYWMWNSGYIFLKMEGTSPAAPEDDEYKFQYHIGGYGGYDPASPTINNIKVKTVDMGGARALVRENKVPQIHLMVDVKEFFGNPNTISIEEHPAVHFSAYSTTIAENYPNMFKFGHVHN